VSRHPAGKARLVRAHPGFKKDMGYNQRINSEVSASYLCEKNRDSCQSAAAKAKAGRHLDPRQQSAGTTSVGLKGRKYKQRDCGILPLDDISRYSFVVERAETGKKKRLSIIG